MRDTMTILTVISSCIIPILQATIRGGKRCRIGANNGTEKCLLKQECKDDIEVKDAIGLVLRTMSKRMDNWAVRNVRNK
jgi:hypothetical protein